MWPCSRGRGLDGRPRGEGCSGDGQVNANGLAWVAEDASCLGRTRRAEAVVPVGCLSLSEGYVIPGVSKVLYKSCVRPK